VVKATEVIKERKKSQSANLNLKTSARIMEERDTRVECQNAQSVRL